MILFIGFNPGLYSAQVGHYFAHKNNKFWSLLYQSGLIPRKLEPTEDKVMLTYHYGLTDIVKRPTQGIKDLKKEEYLQGRARLKGIIKDYKPSIACFLGIGIYKEFSQLKQIKLGLQQISVVEGTTDFVAPSPSGLNMMPFQEKLKYFCQLKAINDAYRHPQFQ